MGRGKDRGTFLLPTTTRWSVAVVVGVLSVGATPLVAAVAEKCSVAATPSQMIEADDTLSVVFSEFGCLQGRDARSLHFAFMPALPETAISDVQRHFMPPLPVETADLLRRPASGGVTLRITLKPDARWPLPAGAANQTLYLKKVWSNSESLDVVYEGPTVAVADVRATPTVSKSTTETYATSLSAIIIKGRDFNVDENGKRTAFVLDRDRNLRAGVDYAAIVESSTVAALSLLPGKSWGEPGPLSVVAVDVGAGPHPLEAETSGVQIATIKADPTIEPDYTQEIYAYSTTTIVIRGSNFDADSGTSIVLSPAPQGGTRVVECESDRLVIERLDPASPWVPKEMLPENDGVASHATQGVALRVAMVRTVVGTISFDAMDEPVVGVVFDDSTPSTRKDDDLVYDDDHDDREEEDNVPPDEEDRDGTAAGDESGQTSSSSSSSSSDNNRWLVLAIIFICAATVVLTLFGFCYFFSTRSGVVVGILKPPPRPIAVPCRKLLI